MTKKKIIITGSLGYVGSVLAPYLIERGYEIRGFDTGFFKDALLYPAPPYETTIKDARDITKDDLRGYDAVVHLAAMSNDPFGNLNEHTVYGVTREYAKTIAGYAKELGMDFIFPSSCSVYGAGIGELTDEEGPTVPITAYSRNKLEVEEELRKLTGDGFAPVALRFATAYGLSPRIRFDLVINMLVGMASATGKVVLNSDGKAWRPFIHVEDMAHAIEQALLRIHQDKFLILNAGTTSENFQIIDVAQLVAGAVPGATVSFLKEGELEAHTAELVRDRKVEGADKRTYRVSFERIREILPNFSPRHTVAGSVSTMLARLRELGFTEKEFKNRGFYRLQRMEDLFESSTLDENLRWREPQPHVYP